MRIDGGNDRRVEWIGWADLDPAVIAQRRIDRDRSRKGLDGQSIKPSLRYQIEQRRRGDQIDRPVERGFEVVVEIDRDRRQRDAGRPRHVGCARQQTEIVVDEPPILAGGKSRRQRAQCRAGPAGEIDDPKRGSAGQRSHDGIEHRRIARAERRAARATRASRPKSRSCGGLERARE